MESCVDQCPIVDATRCAMDVIETCARGVDGCTDWAAGTDCGDEVLPMLCDEGSGAAECVLACSDECPTEGEARCDGAVVETCTLGDAGCLIWEDGTDCAVASDYCEDLDGDARCRRCPLACDEDATRCAGTVIETCTVDGNGCLEWEAGADCAILTGTPICDDAPGEAACVDRIPTGDSCDDLRLVALPFVAEGEDLLADYTDQLTLEGPGCFPNWTDTPEAVFAVDLGAGETLVVDEVRPETEALITVQLACGETERCVADTYYTGGALRYTAESAGRLYVIVELRSWWGPMTPYEIHLDIALPEDCGNGRDDDADGAADCADPDCFGVAPCDVEALCADFVDNDGDDDLDCDDADCAATPACEPYQAVYEHFEYAWDDGVMVPGPGYTLTFTPDASEPYGYSWAIADGVTAYAVEPGSGLETSVLALGNDDFAEHVLTLLEGFDFYGVTYTSLFVGSNGYVTFGSGDRNASSSMDSTSFFRLPRVAAIFRDFDPSLGGTITVDELADRVAVTWDGVPFAWEPGTGELQIVLHEDGAVELVYLTLSTTQGIVGIGRGPGVPPVPAETDFSATTPEVCDDGLDNDGDGVVDCADTNCRGVPVCNVEDWCDWCCQDRSDNDGDGLVDCADPDCEAEPSCEPEADCGDGLDDDGDGWADCDDPGCAGVPPCDREDYVDWGCWDGWDNDGDGLMDCDDPDCLSFPECNREVICDDGLDNDGDRAADCDDDDCRGAPVCNVEDQCEWCCQDWLDTDGDGLVDCADPDCEAEPTCEPEEDCGDGLDDDGDGFPDCLDPGCRGVPPCDREDQCDRCCWDGWDNDGDGLMDCDDPDCEELYCQPEVCDDGLDNDGDGVADCQDSSCFGIEPCDVEDSCDLCCQDGWDNDHDSLVDCADPDCAELPGCEPARGLYELFELDPFDLEGHLITFSPDESAPEGYTWAIADGVTGFVVEPGTGTESTLLSLTDDSFIEYELAIMESVEYFGVAFSSFFVGSNGYVTFGGGDSSYSSDVGSFFAYPRVAGLMTDLWPPGGAVRVDELADHVAITFVDVPLYGGSERPRSSFQILLHSDGVIDLVYVDVNLDRSAIAGVGSGGMEPFPAEANLSEGPL